VSRTRQPDEYRRGGRPHRGDVGKVHRHGFPPDLFRAGPVRTEVEPLHQHVGSRDNPAVRCGDHRGIVARSQHRLVGLSTPCRHVRDRGELTEPRHRFPFGSRLVGFARRHGAPSLRWRTLVGCPTIADLRYVRSVPEPNETTSQALEPKGRAVVYAYILIQTEVGKAAAVATEIANIAGVTMSEDVTGPYDVIVRAGADDVDTLGQLVVASVQNVEGITRTLTCPV